MLQSPPLGQEHPSQPSLLPHSGAESHAESLCLFWKKPKANVMYKLISLCLHRHRHNFLLQKKKKITFPQGTEALPWSPKALPPTPHHPHVWPPKTLTASPVWSFLLHRVELDRPVPLDRESNPRPCGAVQFNTPTTEPHRPGHPQAFQLSLLTGKKAQYRDRKSWIPLMLAPRCLWASIFSASNFAGIFCRFKS